MKDLQRIRLKGTSKRGKDRINSHGDTFILVKKGGFGESSTKDMSNSILVMSLKATWRGEKWLGWLEVGREVEIVK